MMKVYELGRLLCLGSLFFLIACNTDPQANSADQQKDEPLIVNSRLRAEPDRLNPVMTWRGWSIQVNNHIFSPLIEYDPQLMELTPVLAKARPVVQQITDGPFAGGTAYTFEIQEKAVWDNGQPVLASDYEFTLKAVMNPQTGGAAAVFRSALNVIKDVTLYSDNPRKLTVTVFPASFRGEYTAGGFGLLPESVYDPEGLMRPFAFRDIIDEEKVKTLVEEQPNLQKFGKQFTTDKYAREVVSGAGAYALKEWVAGEK
ncbi:MAG: ABC transporter substrate-binding protein, partial [Bacteroidota bacterium]